MPTDKKLLVRGFLPNYVPICVNCEVETKAFSVLTGVTAGANSVGYPTTDSNRIRLFACPNCYQVYISVNRVKELRKIERWHGEG